MCQDMKIAKKGRPTLSAYCIKQLNARENNKNI